jgi:hypothetical protein
MMPELKYDGVQICHPIEEVEYPKFWLAKFFMEVKVLKRASGEVMLRPFWQMDFTCQVRNNGKCGFFTCIPEGGVRVSDKDEDVGFEEFG